MKFSETTLIPISAVISLIGCIAWATEIKATSEQNKERIARIEKEYFRVINEIDERLSRLEGKLEIYQGKHK